MILSSLDSDSTQYFRFYKGIRRRERVYCTIWNSSSVTRWRRLGLSTSGIAPKPKGKARWLGLGSNLQKGKLL